MHWTSILLWSFPSRGGVREFSTDVAITALAGVGGVSIAQLLLPMVSEQGPNWALVCWVAVATPFAVLLRWTVVALRGRRRALRAT